MISSNLLNTKIYHIDFIAPANSYSNLPKSKKYGNYTYKVPKCEIFDRSDFPDFYTIKSSWVGDLVLQILAYYLNFSGS
jgi:hypothetical protein